MSKIPDSIGIAELGLDEGVNFLGTPSVVDRILRDALGKVVDIRRRQLKGEAVNLRQEVMGIATALQDIFYGKNADYLAGPWHKPSLLGRSLVDGAGIGGSVDDAVYRLILSMIGKYVKAYTAFEAGSIDDDEIRGRIDDIVKLHARILMGRSY